MRRCGRVGGESRQRLSKDEKRRRELSGRWRWHGSCEGEYDCKGSDGCGSHREREDSRIVSERWGDQIRRVVVPIGQWRKGCGGMAMRA